MMKVGVVRMPVPEPVMPMPVGMRLGRRPLVDMLMMLVVDVPVFVLDRLVRMVVLMAVIAIVLLSEPVTVQLIVAGALMAFGLWLQLCEGSRCAKQDGRGQSERNAGPESTKLRSGVGHGLVCPGRDPSGPVGPGWLGAYACSKGTIAALAGFGSGLAVGARRPCERTGCPCRHCGALRAGVRRRPWIALIRDVNNNNSPLAPR
jgi:hypothetical protein